MLGVSACQLDNAMIDLGHRRSIQLRRGCVTISGTLGDPPKSPRIQPCLALLDHVLRSANRMRRIGRNDLPGSPSSRRVSGPPRGAASRSAWRAHHRDVLARRHSHLRGVGRSALPNPLDLRAKDCWFGPSKTFGERGVREIVNQGEGEEGDLNPQRSVP